MHSVSLLRSSDDLQRVSSMCDFGEREKCLVREKVVAATEMCYGTALDFCDVLFIRVLP